MHTNEPRKVEGVDLGYDPRDIETKPIIKVVIAFFAFTLIFFGMGAFVFMRTTWGHQTPFDVRKPQIVGPRVQGNVSAKVDIMQMRQAETKGLTTYDPKGLGGGARIPVDRAMDLLVERGLPAIKSEAPAKTVGNTIKDNAIGPSTTPSERAPMSSSPASPTPAAP